MSCTRAASVQLLVSGVTLVLLLGTEASAVASSTPPSHSASAIQQYVEVVPTASGGAAVGVGKTSVKPLAPVRAQEVRRQAGTAAPALEQVATSSVYGVPTKPLRVRPTDRGRSGVRQALAPTRSKPLNVPSITAIGAAGGGGLGRLAGLGIVLLATTGVAVAVAVRRRNIE